MAPKGMFRVDDDDDDDDDDNFTHLTIDDTNMARRYRNGIA
jgi:hypothetical protein